MKIKRSDFLKLMSVTAASAVLAGCVCRRKGGPEHGQFPGQQRVRPGG